MGRAHKDKKGKPAHEETDLERGARLVQNCALFGVDVFYRLRFMGRREMGRSVYALSRSDGVVLVNKDACLSPKQWAYAIAHCMLHNSFGHYDMDKVPGYYEEDIDGKRKKRAAFNRKIWNIACDIYVDRFLREIKLGDPISRSPVGFFPMNIMEDEIKIYDHLISEGWDENDHAFGVGGEDSMDMIGLDDPVVYEKGRWGYDEKNEFAAAFVRNIARSVTYAIEQVSDHITDKSKGRRIANWFINNFPLLGALAASFKIIEDRTICQKYDISIAAVDAREGEIYINPSVRMSEEEWRFVMAHEFLHAALLHHRRDAGRDKYLWNIATDYVINGWLMEMQIGAMPEGALYDPAFKNMSAEEIYDMIVSDIRSYMKKNTFRGGGLGDIMGRDPRGDGMTGTDAVSLDDLYRKALSQGLEYELSRRGRGYIPAGLVEEIRALAMPPIPWDVKLAEWFKAHIKPVEKHRSYAHPSRRQSCTPDIPRPRYVVEDDRDNARTFGVVIDTSGSMATDEIGKALGAIASYAASREVPAARVVFCDACAYDAGYMSPDDIAGRVRVVGRGGTRLQPGIDMLQGARDFPKDGPILIITDGGIEQHLDIKREHAYILPGGCRLPFKARGEVFRM